MKAIVVEGKGRNVLFETDVDVEIPESMGSTVEALGIRPGETGVGAVDDIRREFKEIEGVIIECAKSIGRTISSIPTPDEVSVEFGVKLGGEVGIPLVTKGTAEANFKIAIKWKPAAMKEAAEKAKTEASKAKADKS